MQYKALRKCGEGEQTADTILRRLIRDGFAKSPKGLDLSLRALRQAQDKLRAAIRLAEQVVLRPPQADRRISMDEKEIPRFTRDSAPHWIAMALRASQ